MPFAALLRQHAWEIGRLTFEHLWLTVSALLLAAAFGWIRFERRVDDDDGRWWFS